MISAYLVSGAGTALSAVAIPWLVLVTTGSAIAAGIVGFAELTPYVLVQATAGPLVDRMGLRRTILFGNSVAGAAVLAIFVLDAVGALPVAVLACLVALAGAARGAADAASVPLIPPLARAAHWSDERAVGLYSGANRAALLIGMPLAGVLVALVGPAPTILLDAISFMVAGGIVAWAVPRTVVAVRREAPRLHIRAYVEELREGIAFLRRDRLLVGLTMLIVLTNLLDQAMTTVFLPLWAHNVVQDAVAFGIVGGASGLGMLIGVLGMAGFGQRLPRWATFALCTLLASAPPFFAVAGWAATVPVALVFLVCGIFGGVPNPIIGAVQFERIPVLLQTRVLGAIRASAYVGIPFGALVGGVLGQWLGLTGACLLAGIVMLVATLAPSAFPVWRELDRRRAAPEG